MDVEKLARRLKRRDEKALSELILHFTPLMSTIIYNVGHGAMTKEDIEEVTSDVFLTLWNNTDKIQPDKLKGYLCCIAKTRAINKLASLHVGTTVDIDDYDPQDSFSLAEHTEQQELHQELRQIIDTIDEPDREILIRYYYYYQTTTKIAEVMQLNLETVKSKLKRTRQKIKSILTERGYSR